MSEPRSAESLPHAGEPVLDVLAFGEAIVDFFPPRPGIALRDAETFSRHSGGAPANVCVGLARLGARAGLVTLVGPDEFGAFLRESLAREGVDVSAVGVHPTARTGITFVAVGANGERSFSFYRHASADQLVAPEHVAPAVVTRARVLHVGSSTLAREPARSATLAAVAAARAAGRVLSCDPNLRPHLWEAVPDAAERIRALLVDFDLVKLAEDELGPLLGASDAAEGAQTLRRLGVGLAVVTLGERGCWFDGATAGVGHVPGVPVEVVDTTGAGDGFVAGLLAELAAPLATGARPGTLPREVVERSCAFANRVAARVVTRFGATAALPRRAEL